MSTFGTMQDRIEDEIRDTSINTQVQRAIQSAISHWKAQPFWFNYTYDRTFNTVDGTDDYSDSTVTDMVTIDFATVTASDVPPAEMKLISPRDLEVLKTSVLSTYEAQPQYLARIVNSVRLFPTPDAVYTITMTGVENLGTLSADADTNAWMTFGEELIRARAKYIIYRDIKAAPAGPDAQAALLSEREAFHRLLKETSDRAVSIQITPYGF